MIKFLLPFSILLLLYAVGYSQPTIHKTYCESLVGQDDLENFKKEILQQAKRRAVNELFGELITGLTKVESGILSEDRVQAASVGFVRIDGNPRFYNGNNLGEVCVDIAAYATNDDRAKFNPVPIENKYCATNPDMTTRELKEFAREEAIVQGLIDYDRKLEDLVRQDLLRLVHQVKIVEEGFVPDTETYCAEFTGVIYPIEILASLENLDSVFDLSGKWWYLDGKGECEFVQKGTQVTMNCSWLPGTEPKPHYTYLLDLEGKVLSGTWVNNNSGDKPKHPFHAEIEISDGDGGKVKRIICSQATSYALTGDSKNRLVYYR